MAPCMTHACQLMSIFTACAGTKAQAIIRADGILLVLVSMMDDKLHAFSKVMLLA